MVDFLDDLERLTFVAVMHNDYKIIITPIYQRVVTSRSLLSRRAPTTPNIIWQRVQGSRICWFMRDLFNNNSDYKGMEQTEGIPPYTYHYFRSLLQFQYKVLEAAYLGFDEKLLITNSDSKNSFQTPVQELKLGMNGNTIISGTAIRVVYLKKCCYCLMTATHPQTATWLIILGIVYPEQRSKPLGLGIFSKTHIKLIDPFVPVLITAQQHDRGQLPIILVSHKNVFPLNKFDTTIKKTSEELRQQANNYFKAKKYLQAINLYEMALANLYEEDKRQRSVLYSNAAACLFELRLYQSCLTLSDVAIFLDPNYNKGYYRKIRSLLQLHQFEEITPLLIQISRLISKSQYELLNQKYTEVLAQEGGFFNWPAIINGTCSLGEYLSPKIKLERISGDIRVVAQQTIEQYETIVVSRPLIYVQESGRNFKESFMEFLKQIQHYSLCDAGFQKCVYLLPCECHPLLSQRAQNYQEYMKSAKALPMKQLFSKLQRSVFEERSLEKADHMNGYGIWKEMFYFEHKCVPNCSTIHINGYLLVSALEKLQQGQILSLDLIAQVEPSRRSQSMRIKLDQDCSCQMCEGKEFGGNFTSIEQLYDEIEMMTNPRRKKQYIWSILQQQWQEKFTLLDEDAIQLIYYYGFYVEKECEWDDLHNLIRARTKYYDREFHEHIEKVTTRYLSNYFKTNQDDSKKIYDALLKRTLSVMQA